MGVKAMALAVAGLGAPTKLWLVCSALMVKARERAREQ